MLVDNNILQSQINKTNKRDKEIKSKKATHENYGIAPAHKCQGYTNQHLGDIVDSIYIDVWRESNLKQCLLYDRAGH